MTHWRPWCSHVKVKTWIYLSTIQPIRGRNRVDGKNNKGLLGLRFIMAMSPHHFSPSLSLSLFFCHHVSGNSVNSRPEGHSVREESNRTREARTLAPWWVTLSRRPRRESMWGQRGERTGRKAGNDREGGVDKRERGRERGKVNWLLGLKRGWRWPVDSWPDPPLISNSYAAPPCSDSERLYIGYFDVG